MKAVTWHGKRDVRVDTVDDPRIEQPTDVIIKVTSSGICGSDLHLYEVLGPYLEPGDIIGHEPMGIIEEVGSQAGDLKVGDRVVVPFNISCGHCFMCDHGLQSQCETTQVREEGSGAALLGYTKLYGQVPGGQAEYLRVPHADYGPITVPEGPPDDRFVYLSDVMPTAWQGLAYADVPKGGSLAVIGLGPIGEMVCRMARQRGDIEQLLAIEPVAGRAQRARALGVTVLDGSGDVLEQARELTGGRGPDAVIDAVGMEAHGAPVARIAHQLTGLLPSAVARKVMDTAGVDRLAALHLAIELVRRGGTVSILGVYGGMADPLPMMTMFDKQVTLRMGQANVRRWIDELLPLVIESDVLGVESFASHHLPLDAAPQAYRDFQQNRDEVFKVLLRP